MATPVEVARRFFCLLENRQIPADGFSEADVWMAMPALLSYAEQGRPLPPICGPLVVELAASMQLPAGASLPVIEAAIERSFGLCPFGSETVALLARYMREQRNGGLFQAQAPGRKGPNIKGEF